MTSNNKARVLALQEAARAFLERTGTSNPSRALAKQFAETHGCTVDTALRHLQRAARGEAADARDGRRAGAGRPPKSGQKRIQKSLALTPRVWAFLAMETLAHGGSESDAIERIVRAQPGFVPENSSETRLETA